MSTPDNTALPPLPRIRLRGPAGLVQAVPYLLGYTSLSDDLVLVGTRDHVTVLTVRVDLRALAAGHLWTATGHALASAGATAVHLVAYPPVGEVTDLTLATLHAHLIAANATRPPTLTIAHIATTGSGRWWAHDLTGPAPAGPGTPIIDDPSLTLGLSVTHGVPATTRDRLVDSVTRHQQPVLDLVEHALRALPRGRTRTGRRRLADAALRRRQARPVDWTIPEAAAILDALTDKEIRDHLVVRCDAEHASWTWISLVPYAPDAWRAPVATLAAVAAHQRGDGLLARAAIDQALAADPGYQLAALFSRVLDLGLTPTQVKENLLAPAAAELAARR
jgi:hypothetical protein